MSVFDPSVDGADDVAGRQLAQLIGGYVPAQVVSALARLGVADELTPAGQSAADLGRALHLPTPPQPSLSYLMDILMMTVEDGRERTRDEFVTLLGAAGYSFARETPVTSPGRELPQRILEFRRV